MELLLEGKIEHGDDPVLRWMANNLVVTENKDGHIKPNKAKSQNKIDGMVAVLMAFTMAIRGGGGDYPVGRYYETHELEIL
jgi:phage terminase large subunit-like protein